MKHLLILLLFVACSKATVSPKYSYDGTFVFTASTVSGQFTLSGGYVTAGFFIVNGQKFTVDTPASSYPAQNYINLVSGTKTLFFSGLTWSSDFNTITSQSYILDVNGSTGVNIPTTITRK